jgi:hypothetical protein
MRYKTKTCYEPVLARSCDRTIYLGGGVLGPGQIEAVRKERDRGDEMTNRRDQPGEEWEGPEVG